MIHGACHGAWCWHRVLPELARPWPAPPAPSTCPATARPAPRSAESPSTVAAAHPRAAATAVLVGHSAGGYAITAAAETRRDLVSGLIYLCACLPRPGQSLAPTSAAPPGPGADPRPSASPPTASPTASPPKPMPETFAHDARPKTALAPQASAPNPSPPTKPRCPPRRTPPPSPSSAQTTAPSRPRSSARWPPPSRPTDGLPARGHSPFFAKPRPQPARLARAATRQPRHARVAFRHAADMPPPLASPYRLSLSEILRGGAGV